MYIYELMKINVFIAILFLVVSCAPQKEIVFVPEILPPVPAPVQSPRRK